MTSTIIDLDIPTSEAESAQEIARQAGGRLLWDPGSERWTYLGATLPGGLERFDPAAGTERDFVLDVPFASRGAARAAGARWSTAAKAHLWSGTHLPAALAPYRSEAFSWERLVEDRLNDTPSPVSTQRVWKPRSHQRDAIEQIMASVRHGRMGHLLGDEVGLGKTVSAWEATRRMPFAKRVLVVCPHNVIPHWRRTIANLGDPPERVVVLNYERLDRLFEVPARTQSGKKRKKKVKSSKALARVGRAMRFDVVIIDESHRCKNPTAARSKMCAKLVERSRFALWLSATAGQNPLELSYLAPLMADVTGARVSDLKDWEQWCVDQGIQVSRGAFGKWEWERNDEDCDTIRGLLFEGEVPAGTRRVPQEIAGWPEINRILTPATLSAEERSLYQSAWSAFRETMNLEGKGKDSSHALVAQLRFRQKASFIRTQSTVDLASDLLDSGHQVAISVAFHESIDAIREPLEKAGHRCAQVHGRMSAREKEENRLAFQRGERKVVLFTVEEGISLHQGEHNDVPRSQIIHDLRWSAIQMSQIEGRSHRDGQFSQMYWMYGEETIEARIAQVVASRVVAMKSMVGDDTETMAEIERLLEVEAR